MYFNFKLNIMFYIGQKVVCIDDSPGWLSGEKLLQKDNIYIVDRMSGMEGDVFIVGFEKSWDKSRFAPLETYRESYSIAIELVQELQQVDKQKIYNPKKETV